MRIAVISDIHGNLEAIEKVLKDIEKENCKRIYCLGDLVLVGKEPKETLDMLRSLDNIDIIQGNTDQMVIGDKIIDPPNEQIDYFIDYAKSRLTQDDMTYLKNLHAQKFFELEGIKFLLVHGSPRRNDENIFPNLKIEEVEEIIKGVDADVIFCGHTHLPCGYQTNNNKTVVNVGSVGRPFTENPDACYVVANVNNGEIEFIHKFVKIENPLR